MSEPLLSVSDLSLGFVGDAGFAAVLDSVNLTVNPGEIMGLVGESGCGKTTLACAVLGVLPRRSLRVNGGAIRFANTDMLDPSLAIQQRAIRGKRLTFIPQDPFTSLNPVLTIGDQIDDLMKWKSPLLSPGKEGRMPALLKGYPRQRRTADREKVLEILDAVQLPQPQRLLAKYPHEVSGGQRQRLMIAMALLPDPDLIIADEPTTALDVTIQAQILGLLRRLANERGAAVLLTTHDLGSAYEICDRITVMYGGQDVEAAPISVFFTAPAHPYTGKLLASLPSAAGGMVGIPGDVPNLYDPPPGCRFAPRCELAVEACSQRPVPSEDVPGHMVRCVNPVRTPMLSAPDSTASASEERP